MPQGFTTFPIYTPTQTHLNTHEAQTVNENTHKKKPSWKESWIIDLDIYITYYCVLNKDFYCITQAIFFFFVVLGTTCLNDLVMMIRKFIYWIYVHTMSELYICNTKIIWYMFRTTVLKKKNSAQSLDRLSLRSWIKALLQFKQNFHFLYFCYKTLEDNPFLVFNGKKNRSLLHYHILLYLTVWLFKVYMCVKW